MFKKNKKSHASFELHDYVLRALVKKGPDPTDLQPIEIPLPVGVMEDGDIHDDMALFDLLKEHVHLFGGKKQPIRFFAPDASVLLKQIDVPKDVKEDDLRNYVQMEVGHSIHLPFQEPLVDVYDPIPDDGKATIFAAPSDVVNKFMNIMLDHQFVPTVVDIRALSNLRLLKHLQMIDEEKTYLVADWSINDLVICIYSAGNVEFLRFQSIETNLEDWVYEEHPDQTVTYRHNGDVDTYKLMLTDQVIEIDRMINFFKFSLHKGDKSIDEIITLGDNPFLKDVEMTLKDSFTMPVTALTDAKVQEAFPQLKAKYSTLIGLALKGVEQ